MSTTTKTEGSYLISILSVLGAGACMVVTALIVSQLGESMGATEVGRQKLSAASVAVHIFGLVLFGLAFGYFERQRGPTGKRLYLGWSVLALFVMLGSGGYTMASIYGFVAAERMSIQQAREQQLKDIAADKQAVRDADKKKLDTQLDLTKGLVDWAKKTVKTDDLSRRERKDMMEAAQKAITNITKENEAPKKEAAPASKEIILRPDAQAEGLSRVTGLPIDFIQNALGMWLAAMLIILEMILWPQATRTWPRKVMVAQQIEERPIQLVPETGTAQLPAPAIPVLAATPVPESGNTLPEKREPVPEPTLEPVTIAIPPRLILLPGAEAWLRHMQFPLEAPRSGNPKPWPSTKNAAQCFACWLRAHDLLGPYSHEQVEGLWQKCCVAYHREQIIWNQFKPQFENVRGVVWKKERIDGKESPRPMRWRISSSAADIRKFAKEDPNQEAAPDPGHRPLAPSAVSVSLEAANDDAPVPMPIRKIVRAANVPAYVLMNEIAMAREIKRMERGEVHRSRKQRGNRIARMARAA